MEVLVLGSVQIRRDNQVIDVGPRLQRLLGALASRSGEVVRNDVLADVVWDGVPPRSAETTLRTYVTRLRHALGDEPDRVIFRQSGYALILADEEIDSRRFELELDEARRSLVLGDLALAEDLVVRALERWTGDPYGGMGDHEALRAECVRLEERRDEAEELRVEVLLTSGRSEVAIAAARAIVEDAPLRERPRELLMRSLYAAGRRADAVRAFRAYRAALADETGLEPSAELAALEGRMVRGEQHTDGAVGRLRGYELGERLGRGAFSVVHRAVQPGLGRDVAVKVVRAELADRPEFVRRFEHEARLVASIEHPHIVPLYDFWREPGAAYLVMRLMRGGDLGHLLRTRGPVSSAALAAALRDLGGALHAAHRAGIVHRDVRPANMLRDEDGAVYLADFGIATSAIEHADRSLHYTAPELIRGDPGDLTTDILSLGVSVFELLTGRLPFAETTDRSEVIRRQLGEPLPPVRSTRTDLPEAIDDVLAKATSKAPGDRFDSVPAFVAATLEALGQSDATDISMATLVAQVRPARNPYVGLLAFGEPDADLFNGRERVIADVVDAIEQRPLVVVVGPSGSGKSSIVRAGVVPAVRRGAIAGSEKWFVVTVVPGTDPIAAIEAALLRVAVRPPGSLTEQMAEPGGLLHAVRRVVPDGGTLMLVVDQFEELFTTVGDAGLRLRFLQELAAATRIPDSPLRVVATLRADHYGTVLADRSMAELVSAGTITVTPMRAEELERAIVEPARTVGVKVEQSLVTELVAAAIDRPAALPLLQFALTEIFERHDGGHMTRESFADFDGFSGALAARADRILKQGGSADELAMRRVFGRLAIVSQIEYARRRARVSEFASDERTTWLIDAFVAARLLVTDRDESSREPTVEVAHEALLRDWPRLRAWLDEDRDDLRQVQRISESSQSWARSGRDDGELARGGRLTLAVELAARRVDHLNELEREWIHQSVARSEADQQAAAAAAARDRRRVRWLRRSLSVAAVLLVVAVGAAGVALVQSARAGDRTSEATARELLFAAQAQLEDDPELASLLAIESVSHFQSAGVRPPSAAGDVFRQAIISNPVVERFEVGDLVDVSDHGERIVTADVDGAVTRDITTFEVIEAMPLDGQQIIAIWFAGDEVHAGAQSGRFVRIVRWAEGRWSDVIIGQEADLAVDDFGDALWQKVASNERWLVRSIAGNFRLWDIGSTSNDIPILESAAELDTPVALSGDGLVAFSPSPGVVRVVRAESGETIAELAGSEAILDLAFSPHDDALAVIAEGPVMRVYEADGNSLRWEIALGHSSWEVEWSGDNTSLLVVTASGLDVVGAATGDIGPQIRSVVNPVRPVSPVPGTSELFVTALGGDIIVKLELERPQPGRGVLEAIELPTEPVRWIAVTSDGESMVAMAQSDVVVIDIATMSPTRLHSGLPFGKRSAQRDRNFFTVPTASTNGEFYAVPDEVGVSQLWATRSGDRLWSAPPGFDIRAVGNNGKLVLVSREGSQREPSVAAIVDISDPEHRVEIDTGPGVVRGHFSVDDTEVYITRLDESPIGAWSTASGRPIADFDSAEEEFSGHVYPSRDGSTVAVSNLDGVAVLFDLDRLRSDGPDAAVELRVPAHESSINPIVLSRDGMMMATVGRSEPIKIWSTVDGAPIATFPIDAAVGGVAFDPTDPSVVYIADGNQLVKHSLDIDVLVDLAMVDVQREMTEPECLLYLRRSCPA